MPGRRTSKPCTVASIAGWVTAFGLPFGASGMERCVRKATTTAVPTMPTTVQPPMKSAWRFWP